MWALQRGPVNYLKAGKIVNEIQNQGRLLQRRLRTSEASSKWGRSCGKLRRFRLPADEVESFTSQHGVTTEELLIHLVEPAKELARPPISGFHVGAVGLAGSGAVYIGVNLEFPGTTLGQSVHAEQFLVVNALRHGERKIDCLAVAAAPCGHCRQFYSELSCSDSVQFIFGDDGWTKFTLAELLPKRFGPEDVLPDIGRLLLEDQFSNICLEGASQELVDSRQGDAAFVKATKAALSEAKKSYAPYSQCVAGAALITESGRVMSGGVIESAAYNPTMPPFQAAIINAVVDDIGDYSQISEVVLVEGPNAHVSHAESTDNLRQKIAPKSTFTLLHHQEC